VTSAERPEVIIKVRKLLRVGEDRERVDCLTEWTKRIDYTKHIEFILRCFQSRDCVTHQGILCFCPTSP